MRLSNKNRLELLRTVKNLQIKVRLKMLKVAIQGIKASFHDVACRKYFKKESNEIELIECQTFQGLFENLKKQNADYAIMAIENALAGSILPNYQLLVNHPYKIIGEEYIHISFCLLSLPATKEDEITHIQSHPMAIYQCQNLLSEFNKCKIIEHADTAEAALDIKKFQLKNYAALASELAASTYGLKILRKNVEDHSFNYTRFLILSREEITNEFNNKASICFELEHTKGSLERAITLISSLDLNMTKIQSLPVQGKPYQYAFHVDVEALDSQKLENSLNILSQNLNMYKLLGAYPKALKLHF